MSFDYLIYERIGIISYYYAVIGYQRCKLVKGIDYMFNILEIVQMVRIYIENNFNLRPEAEKAVHVFAGFGYEVFAVSHLYISVYFSQVSSNQYGRRKSCSVEN